MNANNNYKKRKYKTKADLINVFVIKYNEKHLSF